MTTLNFNVPRDSAELILVEGRNHAVNTNDSNILMWEFDNLEFKIQDDYFNIELPHGGWIYVSPEELTSEHLVMTIEQCPNVVDKNLLIAILEALTKRKD